MINPLLPLIRIVRLSPFRAITSGPDTQERVFGAFNTWQEAHLPLIRPMLCGAPDFLMEHDGLAEWLWAAADGVTDQDVLPYRLVDFPGGLYACITMIDGNDESGSLAYRTVLDWLAQSRFEPDEGPDRRTLYHMLHPEPALEAALGYHQCELFVPVRIRA